MKDAGGHGSNSSGLGNAQAAAKGLRPAAHQAKIQQLDRTLAGSQPWATVQRVGLSTYHGGPNDGRPTSRPSAKAETIAKYMRTDRNSGANFRGSSPNPIRVRG